MHIYKYPEINTVLCIYIIVYISMNMIMCIYIYAYTHVTCIDYGQSSDVFSIGSSHPGSEPDGKAAMCRCLLSSSIQRLVGGLNPSEKYESIGMTIPIIWENKQKVPKHQAGDMLTCSCK